MLARRDVAVRHLEAALARHEDMQAWPLAAMTKHLLAVALGASGSPLDERRTEVLEVEASLAAAALGTPRAVATPGSGATTQPRRESAAP